MITEAELIDLLQKRIKAAGSTNKAGVLLFVDPSYLSGIVHGHVKPGPSIVEAMGYRKVTMYEKVEKK